MDPDTLKLGLLMEAAQSNQKVVAGSLRKLRAASGDIVSVVREEVRRSLCEELRSLEAEARQAADSLHALKRSANMRVLIWSICITAISTIVPLGLACWVIPSRAEIDALRARRDELATAVEQLERRGGRVELRRCGNGEHLCVRVDRKAPMYGEQADFLVVRGY